MVGRCLLGASALVALAAAQNVNNNIAGADDLELLAESVQLGSTFDGTDAFGASDEQAPSRVSNNNFINFCAGETLTNGLQITEGSCNGIPHGQIPAKGNMISSIIVNPAPNDVLQSGQTFNIQVQMSGFVAGSFTNAFATYYSAPQFLDEATGFIIGHTHVTVQDLGSNIAPNVPPDPEQFAFFKGINDAGNGQLLLEAEVTDGLPPGNYRVCTLVAASNHQPVLMPVAQRGAQDDCSKFTVVGNDFDINDAANNGEGGLEAAADVQTAIDLGPGAIDPNADDADAEAEADANADDAEADAQGQDQNDAQESNPFADFFANLAANNNNNNQAQDQQDNQAQGQDDNQAQGQDDNQAQGQDDNQAQGQDDNQAQGQDDNQAQGQDDNQAQDQNGNQSAQAQGGAPTADQLRQQAEGFFNRGQNKRLARFAKRTFVA